MDITVLRKEKRQEQPTGWKAPTITLPWFLRSRKLSMTFVVGMVMVFIIAVLAVFSDTIAPYGVAKMSAERLEGPSFKHFFGTDLFGRDLFSRVLVGARLSLTVACIAVGLGAVPGITMGLMAGMYPGWICSIVSRIMDAWMAVPGLLLAIAMTAAFGRSTLVLATALGIIAIPSYYRQTRAETLSIQSELYVTSARSLGAKERHILFRHVLPNVLPTLIVFITLRLGSILLAVSGLSFIGLGAQPPEPEWGALLADGRTYVQTAWWLTVFPGMAIAMTVFSLNMLGDGLRDMLDPNITKK